ncbi:hypothetical protein DMX02_05905 [Pseudomonas jessenii]|nr:hypothetical protein DMX02_05905 [Pseudomonas jessenii]
MDDDPLWHQKVAVQPVDVLSWYQCDQLGTPRELMDAQGDIAWSADYKAWGSVQEQRSPVARQQGVTNPIRFQGQYHDHETGLHYNRHRYYDPDTGRFIGQDPISYAGGLNPYTYAPNPTGWIDPLGLAKTCCCGEPYVNPDARWRQVMEDPMLAADHRGIQHRYWRKRGGCWTAQMPKSGYPGTGKLSLPKRGALP